MGEHLVRNQEVTGSSPVASTSFTREPAKISTELYDRGHMIR